MAQKSPLFLKIFSNEEEIILLQEYKKFLETPIERNQKKWVEFRQICTLKQDYSASQLSEKIRTLKKKFEKSKRSPPPTDPHGICLLELSKSVWSGFDNQLKIEKNEIDVGIKEVEMGVKIQMCKQNLEKLNSVSEHKNYDDEAKKRCREKMENGDQYQQPEVRLGEDDNIPLHEKCDVDENTEKEGGKEMTSSTKKKKKRKVEEVRIPEWEVVIEEIAEGNGEGKSARRGIYVKVNFVGKLKESGCIFESTKDRHPRTMLLGEEEMIDGFSIGVEGMRVGGKRRLIIPPSMGFGEGGFDDVVPPNSWLEYEVELVDVRD